MTTKQPSIDLDAYSTIMYAAQMGMTYEDYVKKVADMGRKRIRMIGKGLKEE